MFSQNMRSAWVHKGMSCPCPDGTAIKNGLPASEALCPGAFCSRYCVAATHKRIIGRAIRLESVHNASLFEWGERERRGENLGSSSDRIQQFHPPRGHLVIHGRRRYHMESCSMIWKERKGRCASQWCDRCGGKESSLSRRCHPNVELKISSAKFEAGKSIDYVRSGWSAMIVIGWSCFGRFLTHTHTQSGTGEREGERERGERKGRERRGERKGTWYECCPRHQKKIKGKRERKEVPSGLQWCLSVGKGLKKSKSEKYECSSTFSKEGKWCCGIGGEWFAISRCDWISHHSHVSNKLLL